MFTPKDETVHAANANLLDISVFVVLHEQDKSQSHQDLTSNGTFLSSCGSADL